ELDGNDGRRNVGFAVWLNAQANEALISVAGASDGNPVGDAGSGVKLQDSRSASKGVRGCHLDQVGQCISGVNSHDDFGAAARGIDQNWSGGVSRIIPPERAGVGDAGVERFVWFGGGKRVGNFRAVQAE